MQDKKETTQADLDNHSNQLNKNNAEYGNSRNKQSEPVTETQKETSVPKENKGGNKEKLKP